MKDEELQRLYRQAVARRSGTRTDCVSLDRLENAARLIGPEPERLATLNHVMTCPHCQREFGLFQTLAPPSRTPSRTWLVVGLAAGIVLAVAGVFLLKPRPDREIIRGGELGIVLVAPSGRTPAGPAFIWHRVADVTGYRFELLAEDQSLLFSAATSDTSLILPDSVVLQTGREYTWWIRATRPDGSEQRSLVLTFQLDPAAKAEP
jgi:hypothetical protein